LRALGLKAHGGGVGYYRGSFVHLDTGRVRHWPRMSRKQLARVFPKGRTIHVPSDGKPLKGYKVAAANLKKGLNSDGSSRRTKASASLLAGLFKKSGNDGDENEGNVKVAAAKAKPAAKAKTATPAKKSGSDPFALEVAAAKKVKKEEVVKTELEAEAKEPVIEVAENTVTIPKRRPQLVAEATPQIVEVPVPDTENTGQKLEEAEKATQLALAETQPQPKVRPATGDETEQSQQLAAQKRTAGDVVALEALKSRIRTALARQRELSSAEKAVQAQANAELIERVALLRKPKVRPEADTITASSNLGGVDSNQPLGLNGELVQVPTPQWRTDEKSKPTDQSSQIAKLKEKIDAALQARTSQPSAQEVPVPNMVGELKLGDLDGRNVRKWAVALSTRVGPIATLSAPRYGQGTRRAAPVSVYSAGFANNRPPLRADRFSGRALTRVAFAYFTNN